MNQDINTQITETQTKLTKLQEKKAAFEALSREQQLATKLHESCISSHDDNTCGWTWDIYHGDEWTKGSAHKRYLKAAQNLIKRYGSMLTNEDLLYITRKGRL